MPPTPTSEYVTNVPIDSPGVVAQVAAAYSDELAIHLRGDGSADYAVDVSPDGVNWFQGVTTYSGTTIDAVETRPEAVVRLRVTSTSLTGGETADIYLSASPN